MMAGGATPTEAPFGSWVSPITAEFITEAGVGLGGLSCGPASGDLFWVERRPNEGGRAVLCRRAPGDAAASERGAVDVTPAGSNVRTRVHEYGGASHLVCVDGGVFFSLSLFVLPDVNVATSISTPNLQAGSV